MKLILDARNLPESLSGIETKSGTLIFCGAQGPEIYPNPFQGLKLNSLIFDDQLCLPEIYPNPFQGLKLLPPPRRFEEPHWPEIYPNPFQGLKQVGVAAVGEWWTSRNLPESLSGIETFRLGRGLTFPPSRNLPESLSGIET